MARRIHPRRWLGLGAIALAGLLSACEGGQPLGATGGSTSGTALDGGDATAMLVYTPRGEPIDESGFVSLGSPENLGGRVLEGNPEIFARIDYSHNGVTAGLFKATTGKIEVTFPFTEHATVLQGEVTITDGTGQSHTYKAGESYFIRQGSVVIWEVTGQEVIKSFFNTVEAL